MRKLLLVVAVPVATAALAIPALAATKSVKVGDDWFVRSSEGAVPTVTIKRNDTVHWKFVGDDDHTVSVKSGPVRFSSPAKASGTYTKKFTKAGTYRIYCKIHGLGDQSMKLKVTG
jgi:plastocyanin